MEYLKLIKDAVKKGMKAREVKGNVVPACVYRGMLRKYPKEFKEIAKMLAYNASMRLKKKALEKNGDDYEQMEAVKQLILSGMKLNDMYHTTIYTWKVVARLMTLYKDFANFIQAHKYPRKDMKKAYDYFMQKVNEGYSMTEVMNLGEYGYTIFKRFTENQKDAIKVISHENILKRNKDNKSKKCLRFIENEPDRICQFCGNIYTYEDYYKRTGCDAYNFRLKKTCGNIICAQKARRIGLEKTLAKKALGHNPMSDIDRPLTWTDYFDMELRHKYDDTFGEMPMSNLLQRFSKDSEIPLKILLRIRDGRDMITADMANILRKNEVYYSVETIISLQHKLCEERKVGV